MSGFESLSRNFDKVKWLYEQGQTGVQIANALKISTATVSWHLAKIRPPIKAKSKFNWVKIAREYQHGTSITALRKKYKISGGALSSAVSRGDLKVKKKPVLEEVLNQSKRISTHSLKLKLLKLKHLRNQCYECNQEPIWHGKPLSLQLDHIDGNRLNNKLENLRILCPHCHSQTDTWGRKKRK